MKRTFLGLCAATCAVCAWSACVSDDSTTPQDSGSDVTTSDGGPGESELPATLSANPPAVTVVRGASASSTITLNRGSLTGDVTLTVTGAPTGVTATAPPIASGQTTSTLQVQAAANATEGAATLDVSAQGAGDLKIPLLVAGSSGSLDESWDNDGLLIDTTSATGVFYALALQSDGSVVAVGGTAAGGGKWLVRRFDATGKPDAAFDTAAAAAVPQAGVARAVGIDPATNKIVIAGDNAATTDQMVVTRLNADGSADQAFGNAGAFTANNVDFSQGSNANGLVVRADSSIVVVGNTTTTAPPFVFALDATGVADSAFVQYNAPNKGSLTAIVELAGGNLLAIGTDAGGSPPAALAVRLTSNGSPDLSFGASGARTYASPTSGFGLAVATNGDGLVVGTDIVNADSFAELRFTATGSGGQLWSKTFGGGNNARLRAAAAGPNGTTYAAGWYSASMDSYAILERRLSTGDLDTSFGDAGGTLTFADPGTPDTYAYQLYCAKTTPDGRVVVGGSRSIGGTGAVLLRVWP